MSLEERRLYSTARGKETLSIHRIGEIVETKLQRITELSSKD